MSASKEDTVRALDMFDVIFEACNEIAVLDDVLNPIEDDQLSQIVERIHSLRLAWGDRVMIEAAQATGKIDDPEFAEARARVRQQLMTTFLVCEDPGLQAVAFADLEWDESLEC